MKKSWLRITVTFAMASIFLYSVTGCRSGHVEVTDDDCTETDCPNEECTIREEYCPDLQCDVFQKNDDGCDICECEINDPQLCSTDQDCPEGEHCFFSGPGADEPRKGDIVPAVGRCTDDVTVCPGIACADDGRPIFDDEGCIIDCIPTTCDQFTCNNDEKPVFDEEGCIVDCIPGSSDECPPGSHLENILGQDICIPDDTTLPIPQCEETCTNGESCVLPLSCYAACVLGQQADIQTCQQSCDAIFPPHCGSEDETCIQFPAEFCGLIGNCALDDFGLCRANNSVDPPPECRTDFDCEPGICQDGQCVSVNPGSCESSFECAEGDYCANGECIPFVVEGCSSTQDCPSGSECIQGGCFNRPDFCGSLGQTDCEFIAQELPELCEALYNQGSFLECKASDDAPPPNTTCISSDDCQEGLVCVFQDDPLGICMPQ
jgi:hypothetical protein